MRSRYGIVGVLRTSEINAIRATIAKRYGIELAPICDHSPKERMADASGIPHGQPFSIGRCSPQA